MATMFWSKLPQLLSKSTINNRS